MIDFEFKSIILKIKNNEYSYHRLQSRKRPKSPVCNRKTRFFGEDYEQSRRDFQRRQSHFSGRRRSVLRDEFFAGNPAGFADSGAQTATFGNLSRDAIALQRLRGKQHESARNLRCFGQEISGFGFGSADWLESDLRFEIRFIQRNSGADLHVSRSQLLRCEKQTHDCNHRLFRSVQHGFAKRQLFRRSVPPREKWNFRKQNIR